MKTAKLKKSHFMQVYIGGYGKMAKKRVFGVFDPNNRIQQKFDPAYHVGNFLKTFLIKILFPKNWVLTSL